MTRTRIAETRTRRLRLAPQTALVALLAGLTPNATLEAQRLGIVGAVGETGYSGREHRTARGDHFGELALRYHHGRALTASLGASIGKFDDPSSDPSFTAVSVFLDGSWPVARVASLTLGLGPRLSWEHERVGARDGGLWAYGVGYGGIGRVSHMFRGGTSVAVQAGIQYLDLARSGTSTSPVVDARGWRSQIGFSAEFPIIR